MNVKGLVLEDLYNQSKVDDFGDYHLFVKGEYVDVPLVAFEICPESKRLVLWTKEDMDNHFENESVPKKGESEEFLDVYLHEMGKVGDELFGIQYLDDYVNLFPSEDEQAVRDSLTRFAESFHKGHNALSVIILVNKGYIKSWLENNDVKDGYGNLVKL